MKIDFDALRVFTVVVATGGFNTAAKTLHKTQPAVTNSIKKLEQQLGFNLFDRQGYRSQLTTKGKAFYQRAKSLVEHWQHTNEYAAQIEAGQESDITIAIDVFFPLAKLQQLFRQWIDHFPLTQFHFLSESLGGACERLIQGHANFVISENLISNTPIETIILHSEPLIAVATPEYIQSYQDKLQTLDTLNDCMQVILRDSSQSDFSFGVIAGGCHWTVSDVATKKNIIVAGLGWGRLPQHLIQQELEDGTLQRLTGNHFDPRLITLSAIRLQTSIHGPIAQQLWQDLMLTVKK